MSEMQEEFGKLEDQITMLEEERDELRGEVGRLTDQVADLEKERNELQDKVDDVVHTTEQMLRDLKR